MCDCRGVGVGDHTNTVPAVAPWWSSYRFIDLDRCLWAEVIWLWHKGVVTLNSCCGHNKVDPTILVAEESIPLMETLGYEHWENPMDAARRDGFIAKSVARVREVDGGAAKKKGGV